MTKAKSEGREVEIFYKNSKTLQRFEDDICFVLESDYDLLQSEYADACKWATDYEEQVGQLKAELERTKAMLKKAVEQRDMMTRDIHNENMDNLERNAKVQIEKFNDQLHADKKDA